MTSSDIQEQIKYHSGEITRLAGMLESQPKKRANKATVRMEGYIKNAKIRMLKKKIL